MASDEAPRPPASVLRRVIRAGAWVIRQKLMVGSLVGVYDQGGRILLVRQRYDPKRWTLPGGFMKKGERPHETARRELKEETGIVLDIQSADEVAAYKQPWPGGNQIDVLFRMTVADDVDLRRLSVTEIKEAGWFDPTSPPPLTAEAVLALSILAGQRPTYLKLAWYSK